MSSNNIDPIEVLEKLRKFYTTNFFEDYPDSKVVGWLYANDIEFKKAYDADPIIQAGLKRFFEERDSLPLFDFNEALRKINKKP